MNNASHTSGVLNYRTAVKYSLYSGSDTQFVWLLVISCMLHGN